MLNDMARATGCVISDRVPRVPQQLSSADMACPSVPRDGAVQLAARSRRADGAVPHRHRDCCRLLHLYGGSARLGSALGRLGTDPARLGAMHFRSPRFSSSQRRTSQRWFFSLCHFGGVGGRAVGLHRRRIDRRRCVRLTRLLRSASLQLAVLYLPVACRPCGSAAECMLPSIRAAAVPPQSVHDGWMNPFDSCAIDRRCSLHQSARSCVAQCTYPALLDTADATCAAPSAGTPALLVLDTEQWATRRLLEAHQSVSAL